MAEAQTKEQREAAWWDAWWDEDYSWEGLAKKPLQGWVVADGFLREAKSGRIYGQAAPETPEAVQGIKANHRDYWRTDPASGRLRTDSEMGEELVCATGPRCFHRIHVPLAFKDGTPTFKADWPSDALNAIVAPRLRAAMESEGKPESTNSEQRLFDEIEHADQRALFIGAILLTSADHSLEIGAPLRVSFSRTAFVHDVNFEGAAFQGDTSFLDCAFIGAASFVCANFFGGLSFDRTIFLGAVTFDGGTFSKSASFYQTAFLSRSRFNSVAFSGSTNFSYAAFWNDLSFECATFSGHASFQKVTFTKVASFHSTTFSQGSDFYETSFSGRANFSNTSFTGFARFERVRMQYICFDRARFDGYSSFNESSFDGDASFRDLTCLSSVSFSRAAFLRKADFQRSNFARIAWFNSASFQGTMDFSATVFEKLALFEAIDWPVEERNWHRAFENTLFRETLNLKGAGFGAFAAFDGATLERGLQFDETDERSAQTRFRTERDGALRAAAADADAFKEQEAGRRKYQAEENKTPPKPVTRAERAAVETSQRDARLRELERGLRVLKLAMEQSSNKSREQLFYRFELQARRAQQKLPPGEKTFSYLYALTSDYGASMIRPFIALAVLIAAFAGVFYGWDYSLDQKGLAKDGLDGLFQALDLSWSNVFKPLSALSTENDFRDKNALAFRLLYNDAGGVDGQGFAVRAVSTLQSLFALVLAFLFGLAVRRRFQIS